jgi:hypothetical protein
MNIKEVKIIMYLCLEDMPEVKTRADIADALNNVLYENPDLWGELTEENIVDVREYYVRSTRSLEDE